MTAAGPSTFMPMTAPPRGLWIRATRCSPPRTLTAPATTRSPASKLAITSSAKPASSGWEQTYPHTGISEATDTCDNVSGQAEWGYAFSVAPTQHLTGNDFGNFELVSKSGTKYVDANGDGDLTGDSAYDGGWTIRLYKEDSGANGQPEAGEYVSSTTTNGTGGYSFANLGPGTYFVCEAADSAWTQTFLNTTGSEVINTCANANDLGNSRTNADYGYTFTTSSGTDLTGNDFGNFELVSKSGTKYVDANGDGDLTGDSAYDGGWTIRLYKEDSGANGQPEAGEYVSSTTTNGTAGYSFANLGPGTYFVCEAADSAWTQTFPNTTGSEVINTCANANDLGNSRTNADYGYTFTTSSSTDLTGNDFGNFELVSKSGTKYVDANGDGDLTGDSAYDGGWTIRLYKEEGSQRPARDRRVSELDHHQRHRRLLLRQPRPGHLLRLRGSR